MNPVWYPVIVGSLVQLIVAAFVYGQLSNQTKNNAEDIKELKTDGDVQWKAINRHGERISTLEGAAKRANGAAAGR